MLSSTYTLSDIKRKLANDYSFYEYDTESFYEDALESVCEDVERLWFYPRIGSTEYSTISAKDKVDLTYYETNLYWAEVFTVCVEFLKRKSAESSQLQSVSNESLTVEGYSYKINSGGGGASQNDSSIKNYWEMMYMYWKLAGYNLTSLERTCTIFGDAQTLETGDVQ